MIFALPGCGGGGRPKPKEETLVAASCVVKIDGKPGKGVTVQFHPAAENKSQGGCWGQTDEEGHFTVTHGSGKAGIPAGSYNYTCSRFLKPDGSVPQKNEPFITSGATETIAEKWSSVQKVGLHNRMSIPAAGTTSLEFSVESAKKK